MKSILFLVFITLTFSACKSSKKTVTVTSKPRQVTIDRNSESNNDIDRTPESRDEVSASEKNISRKTEKIINTALSYNGTRYKYGGTTKKGMDCSGLVYTSFLEHDVPLNRSSSSMAQQGKKIKLSDAREGDLLFFKTNKKSSKINHVGLIVTIDGTEIKFIHSTTSRGVIVSSIKEGYWNYAFVEARRVL
jgi:cell wall-associated NlpC family hydrolase